MTNRAALTGSIYSVLVVVGFALTGETPSADSSADKVVDFYTDKADQAMISGVVFGIAGVLFLFFIGTLRNHLRSAEGATPGHSSVVQAGGAVAAAGLLIFGGLVFALGDASDTLDPSAVQTLSVLNEDLFIPLAAGMCATLFATGLSALRTGALPRWLAWSALVVAVASLTPLGFFAYIASLVWVLVCSIVLATRVADGATTT